MILEGFYYLKDCLKKKKTATTNSIIYADTSLLKGLKWR